MALEAIHEVLRSGHCEDILNVFLSLKGDVKQRKGKLDAPFKGIQAHLQVLIVTPLFLCGHT